MVVVVVVAVVVGVVVVAAAAVAVAVIGTRLNCPVINKGLAITQVIKRT